METTAIDNKTNQIGKRINALCKTMSQIMFAIESMSYIGESEEEIISLKYVWFDLFQEYQLLKNQYFAK